LPNCAEAFIGIDRHRHTISFSEPDAIAEALRAPASPNQTATPDDQPCTTRI
jgi:hypothetical protein